MIGKKLFMIVRKAGFSGTLGTLFKGLIFLFFRLAMQQQNKCTKVFQSMLMIAIPELIHMANSLIAPVRLGVCRPAGPFSYLTSDNTTSNDEPSIGEELFNIEPMRHRPFTPSSEPTRVSRDRLDSDFIPDSQVEQLEVGDPQPSGDVGELHDIEVCLGLYLV
jgi:hypothetical protein